MSMKDIFDSVNAQEERDILGITREQQGDLKDAEKAQKIYDTAQTDSMMVMDYVRGNEGFRSKIYDDTKKLKTIGSGFNLEDETTRRLLPADVVSGKRDITKEEDDAVFAKRFKIAVGDAISYMGGQDNFTKLSKSQKRGLIDMSYNMGLTRLNKFEKLRIALFKGDRLTAKKEVLDSKYAQKDVPNRADKNANLMLR